MSAPNSTVPRRAQNGTLLAAILASSMTFIDSTVVNVALPALQRDLHATITDVQWVVEAYALLLGALILVGGSIGDQFGRKRVFVAGVIVFTAASLLCGVATFAPMLIACRALQGVGAAFLTPGSLAIISATFGEAERGRAIGAWSGAAAMAAAIGPAAGGWLIEHASWRSAFFVNLPFAAVVVLLSWLFVPESRDPTRSARLDWSGALLAVAGLGGLVFGLIEWPPRGLTAPAVLGALVAGTSLLALFVLVERRTSNPMLSLELFQSRAFTLTNLLTLLLYGAIGVMMFLVPMNLIQVQRYTATQAGAALLPFPVIMFALSRWSGGLVARVGSRLPLTVGPAIAGAGLLLFARSGLAGSYWTTVLPAMLVIGVGMAVTVAPLTTTVMGAVDVRHAGAASGINNAVARVASLLAIAIFGVLLQGVYESRVADGLERLSVSVESAAVAGELRKMAGADVDRMPSLDSSRRAAVRTVIDEAFVSAFRVVIFGAALLAMASALIGRAVPPHSVL